jgi:hypothetical protein
VHREGKSRQPRLAFDHRTASDAMTFALARRLNQVFVTTTAYFRDNRVRVVNMSWSVRFREILKGLEAGGVGESAAERTRFARDARAPGGGSPGRDRAHSGDPAHLPPRERRAPPSPATTPITFVSVSRPRISGSTLEARQTAWDEGATMRSGTGIAMQTILVLGGELIPEAALRAVFGPCHILRIESIEKISTQRRFAWVLAQVGHLGIGDEVDRTAAWHDLQQRVAGARVVAAATPPQIRDAVGLVREGAVDCGQRPEYRTGLDERRSAGQLDAAVPAVHPTRYRLGAR